jgi:hypothetical protein
MPTKKVTYPKVKPKKPVKRSRRPAPARLEKLIKRVNMLPEEYLGDALNLRETRKAAFQVMPRTLADYIALGDSDFPTTDEMLAEGGIVGRYKALWIARGRLRNIARMAEGLATGESDDTSTVFVIDIDYTVRDWIDDEGLIHSSKDNFAEAIDGIPARKIRVCKVCEKMFWAGRHDARQCGDPQCKSTWSSRLDRDPELRKKYYVNRLRAEAARELEQKRAQTARKR